MGLKKKIKRGFGCKYQAKTTLPVLGVIPQYARHEAA